MPSVATVKSGGADQRYYVYLPNGALLWAVEAATNNHHYYHFDDIGSTTFLTDDSGAVTDSYGVTPYGETVTAKGGTVNPFTWLGQWGVMQEGSTGLYYMRYRYYDSTTARFLSRDPFHVLAPQAINPYQYVAANPIFRRDPMGLKDALAKGALVGDLFGKLSTVSTLTGNWLQAIANARADQIMGNFAEHALDWWVMTAQKAEMIQEFRSGLYLERWRDAVQAGKWVNFTEWFVEQHVGDLVKEEAATVQKVTEATEGLSASAKVLKTGGVVLAIAGVALQTGSAAIEDVHNGAGVVATLADVQATALSGGVVNIVPGGALLNLATGGALEEQVGSAFKTPIVTARVVVGRVTNRDAEAFKAMYTRGWLGKLGWSAGEYYSSTTAGEWVTDKLSWFFPESHGY